MVKKYSPMEWRQHGTQKKNNHEVHQFWSVQIKLDFLRHLKFWKLFLFCCQSEKYLHFSQSNTSWVFSHIFTTCSFIWPVNFSAASTPTQWHLYLKTKITQQKFTGGSCMTSPALSCSLPTRRTSERAPEQAPEKHLLHWLPLYHKKLYNIRQQDRNRYETPRTFRYQTSLGIPMQVSDWAAGKTSSPAPCQCSAVLAGQELWPQSHPSFQSVHFQKYNF